MSSLSNSTKPFSLNQRHHYAELHQHQKGSIAHKEKVIARAKRLGPGKGDGSKIDGSFQWWRTASVSDRAESLVFMEEDEPSVGRTSRFCFPAHSERERSQVYSIQSWQVQQMACLEMVGENMRSSWNYTTFRDSITSSPTSNSNAVEYKKQWEAVNFQAMASLSGTAIIKE